MQIHGGRFSDEERKPYRLAVLNEAVQSMRKIIKNVYSRVKPHVKTILEQTEQLAVQGSYRRIFLLLLRLYAGIT